MVAKVLEDRRAPRRRGRMGTGVKENAPEALRRGVREFALQAFHPPPQRRARFPRLLELPRARLRRLRRLRGGFSRVRVLRERLLEPLAERDVFSARRLYRVERRQLALKGVEDGD